MKTSRRTLSRELIVEHAVRSIMQSPWEVHQGIRACSCFVFFSENCIQIDDILDSFSEQPIPVAITENKALVLPDSFLTAIVGQKINEVVISYSFPPGSLGLLLENNSVLCCTDYSPFQIGPTLVDPSKLNNPILTYWGHKELS